MVPALPEVLEAEGARGARLGGEGGRAAAPAGAHAVPRNQDHATAAPATTTIQLQSVKKYTEGVSRHGGQLIHIAIP